MLCGWGQGTATLVTKTARHLLAFACDAGAPALAHVLLPSASVGCGSAAEVVAAVDGAEAQGGTTLLHRAARSGCAPLLRGLLAWGSTHGFRWKVRQSSYKPYRQVILTLPSSMLKSLTSNIIFVGDCTPSFLPYHDVCHAIGKLTRFVVTHVLPWPGGCAGCEWADSPALCRHCTG